MERKSSELKRKIVMLTLTENCNLSCVYCFEKEKTKMVMDINTAKEALLYEFLNSDDFDEIEIDLFGGEPTLRMDVIKELVNWTYNQGFSKPYLFFLETNGTLVHGEIKNWLKSNSDYVWAGLSLDGTPETHNKNRSNSYKKIDIDFFVKTYPGQSVRMTINRDTIFNLSNDIIHLHNLGFEEVLATFAFGINWEMDNLTLILKEELEKLCNFYIANPTIKECSIFDMLLPEIVKNERKITKWCGTGTSMVSYGVDGTKYPCQTFQQNTTVNQKAIKLNEIDFNEINDFSDVECSNCILEPICPNCYGMNYVKAGTIMTRDKQLCEIVKIRALATSYLRGLKLKNSIKNVKPNEAYQTILAINKIQNNIN